MSGPPRPRLFVASEAPEDLKTAFASIRSSLAGALAGARWARPEGIHLTYCFLGAAAEDLVPAVASALAGVALDGSPFGLVTGPAGLFGTRSRPRVLYASLAGDGGAASALRSAVEAALEPFGFARETRPFHPHLTIARFDPRGRARVGDGILEEVGSALAGFEFPVQALVLFESVPAAGGSRYVPRRSFPLGEERA